jgi:quinohemoprotein ethanol dehydrogenase
MTNTRLAILALSLTLSVVATGISPQAQQTSPGPIAAAGAREWPAVGGHLSNARYSPLAAITPDSVQRLGGVWISDEFDRAAVSRATPVVVDGVMYVTAGPWIQAFDARTGKVAWKYRHDEREVEGGALMNPGAQAEVLKTPARLPAAGGVAAGDGLVFAGLTGGEVIALDASSGVVKWRHHLGDNPPRKGESVSAPPVYARGVVVAGLANGDFGVRGRIVAMDARTGKELWRFYVVPGPGEHGHETWQRDNDVWMRGGGGVWLPGAVDPNLNTVYYSTGNPVPMMGGEVRGGDNLFTSSVVALDLTTGRRRWHYQFIHHDVWDADIAVPPVLFETTINGRLRQGIAALRSDGFLFLLDRASGEPILPIEERPVPQEKTTKTASTQPFPAGGEGILPGCDWWKAAVTPPPGITIGCTYTPLTFESTVVAPGFGVRLAPMSYSQRTGYFYATGGTSLGSRRRLSRDPYFVNLNPRRPPGLSRTYTVLAAIDSRTNRLAWKRELPAGPIGPSGVLSAAGGLLFRVAGDGYLEATDDRTGNVVWRFNVGAIGGGGPVAMYELDGREYLAVAARRRVWVLAIDGTLPALPDAHPRAPVAPEDFAGAIQDATEIETAAVLTDMGINGRRHTVDEHAFTPYRARMKAGTRVTFINNGTLTHTIVAQDGAWSVGRLTPAQAGSVTLTKPGAYAYRCTDHPFAYGQLLVVE